MSVSDLLFLLNELQYRTANQNTDHLHVSLKGAVTETLCLILRDTQKLESDGKMKEENVAFSILKGLCLTLISNLSGFNVIHNLFLHDNFPTSGHLQSYC